MTKRLVFIANVDGDTLLEKEEVEFKWHMGLEKSQMHKNIQDLHEAVRDKHHHIKILEISSKSPTPLGVRLSAFNLKIHTRRGLSFSVETAYQASKVFELGGAYTDLYTKTSKEAKTDRRLKTSGALVGFDYFGRTFPSEPRTFFYNWLYINALVRNEKLAQEVLAYDAFTDIVFNHAKSTCCQAEAIAIYVALEKKGLLAGALKSVSDFKHVVYSGNLYKTSKQEEISEQIRLF